MIINPYSKYAKRIEDIIFLYHNSWGETRFDNYRGELDIANIIGWVSDKWDVVYLSPLQTKQTTWP